MARPAILTLLFFFILISAPAASDDIGHDGKVKIGFFSLEPISFPDENGEAQGFNPDLLKKIAELEGWQPVFIHGSWGEGIDRLEANEIDLMINVAYSEDRAKKLDYNYEPTLQLWGQVFIRPNSNIKLITDLAGKRVGIQRRGINGQNFIKTAKDLGIHCEIVTYENLVEVFEAVQRGDVIAGVSPQHYGLRNASEYGLVPSSIQFSPFPIYFAVKKGLHRRLLSQIDSYLIRWKEDKDSYYYQRLNYWMGSQGNGSLIPRWLWLSMAGIGCIAVLLLAMTLLFKRQVRKKTAEVVEASRNLAASERRYRNLVESMVQPMALHRIVRDASGTPVDGLYLDANKAFAESVNKEPSDILGKKITDLIPDISSSWLEGFGSVAETGTPLHFEDYLETRGRYFDIICYSPVAEQFSVVATDVTERVRMQEKQKRLEEQMLHAQKLESLGVLAGGIAHDFNNILMAVLGHCELALRRMVPDSAARKNVEEIKNSANKAADLANQMLAYSGKGKFVIEPLDLSQLAQEMEQMLNVSISKKAILRYELTEDLPSVEADATQLRQVVLNLAINASDAIGDRSGVIAITTGVMDCSKEYLQNAWLDEGLPAGRYVYLEVADTGCGMDRETIGRIFEPFYTTKPTGRGLGMAAVLGIVRGHQGTIKIYSEKNKGSTFKVLLPFSDKPAAPIDINQDIQPLQTSGTVLLVDDDGTVRGIGREMLEEFGYAVITAHDGRDAIEKFQQTKDISFVLMDLTMPRMDGVQAFRELVKLDKNVKVIISSGYNPQEIAQKFAGRGICGFLKKPYQLSALQKEINKLFIDH